MSLSANIGINYTSRRIYWKGASGGGSDYGWYTVNAFYKYLQGSSVLDADAQMDDLDMIEANSPTSYGGLNAWFFDPEIFKHLYGAGFQSGGYTGAIQQITMVSGGYTNFVASDLDKQVQDDGVSIGYLLKYDNTARKIWVRATGTVATGSAITVVSGTGAGTSTGSSLSGEDFFSNIYTLGACRKGNFYVEQADARLTSWWDGAAGGIRKLTFNASGYTNAISGDVGKTVVGGTSSDTATLLAFNNTTREWWVLMNTSGDTFPSSEAITITTGTGAGTTAAASTTAEGNSPSQSSKTYLHIDILVLTQQAGAAIGSYQLIIYNRNFGDTYSHLAVDLTGAKGDRTPLPLQTAEDKNFTDSGLTEGQVQDLVATTHGGDGTTADIGLTFGSFTADVNNNGANENYSARLDIDDPENTSLLYAYLGAMWIISKDRTETLNGKAAALYRSANHSSFTDEPAAPVASYAGGKLLFAQGVYPINVPAAQASNYVAKDDSGNAVNPPTFVSGAVTGLVGTTQYDRVTVFQSTGAGSETVKKDELTSHASNNAQGDSTFEATANVPADKPATGYLRVVDASAGTEHRYRYASYAGAVVTLPTAITGTTTAAGSNNVITNSGATFLSANIQVGDIVRNSTDASWAYVLSIDSNTQITTTPLQGGSDNLWQNGDGYSFHTLVVAYTSSDTAYIGYIDKLASGTSVSAALQYVTDRPLVIRVRNNRHSTTPMVPFVVTSTLSNTGFSIPVSRFVDAQAL